MKVEVPLGDVIDRITILRIKAVRIDDAVRRAHAVRELAVLEQTWREGAFGEVDEQEETELLSDVNARLWEVEDRLREHERLGDFGPAFIALARSVYRLNDRRAALKSAVNARLGSRLVEVKSYSS